ncbi:Card1-like endonuclease domain-containing protein [Sulfurivermis fontis]|jgi:hypothetical protein|uniref:Card1-like endonuclease domain-containing protein n=1 Tax=Sulfurivermis fontis TaxID=1972068 RepID=UPI000FD94A1D|nr:DUF1887 family CARF protein [Sulfurivermis fontis]
MTTNATTHLYLVSDQPTPNLTPALDPALKPQRVILAVTKDLQRKAGWLRGVLERHGIPCETLNVDDAYDFAALRRLFARVADDPSCAANITGGTKPMSLAAYEAFLKADRPVFYVNPKTDTALWLHPPGQPQHPLADKVLLEDFLAAHGMPVTQLRRTEAAQAKVDAAAQLLARTLRRPNLAGLLNVYASANAGNDNVQLSEGQLRALRPLLAILERNQIATRQGENIVLPNQEAITFTSGGWLEELAFATVAKLRLLLPQVQDIACNIKISAGTGEEHMQNELDIAVLRDNTLYLIECKTENYSKQANPNAMLYQNPNAVLYQLESLTRATGGIKARGLLLSLHDIKQGNRRRAEASGLQILAGPQLEALPGGLHKFLLS